MITSVSSSSESSSAGASVKKAWFASSRRWLRAVFILSLLSGIALTAQGLYIPAKALVAQVLLERAFTETQTQGTPVRPWPWADSWPVARISVPRLEESAIILSGGTGQALAFGPTVLPQSAPLGSEGTTVLAAHRDTHFQFLKDVQPGDLILVEDAHAQLHSYRVTNRTVVHKDAFAVANNGTSSRLALTTCWPFDALTPGPWRYVVTAEAYAGG
jgi:sortase A